MVQQNNGILQAQRDVLKILGESGDDYLFLWEIASSKIHFSKNIEKGYPIHLDEQDSCAPEDWYRIVYTKDCPALKRRLEQVRRGEIQQYTQEYRILDRKGNRVWINCRGQCQLDEQGKPVALIGRVSDTYLKEKVDLLTGAFNPSELSEEIERRLKKSTPCFLVLMGVDNLKHINLRHGREYGNHILQKIVDVLDELVGDETRIYRTNGDCFAVNIPEQDPEKVETLYNQLCARLEDYCTVSAGVVSYHEHQNVDAGSLYQYAEDSLDKAKRRGKGRLAFFSQKDYEERLSTIELQEELENSIQNNFEGFSVRYQPQIQAGSCELFGAEVLLRYHSVQRGDVSPLEFIPVLEQSGMICPVGMWILNTALEQCRQWRTMLPDLHISVNMSYVQLDEENIARQVLDALEQSGLPGDALTLEVTESIQLQDYLRFNKIFYQWKQAGIEISVDDFGTGYSSLGYLKNLDIDEIKIDRCFVRGIQHSAYNYRLLSNMLELARSSQIRVCCEGVETREELLALDELRPDSLQGFLFNKPLTGAEFENTYVRTNTPEHQGYEALKKELRRIEREAKLPARDMTYPEGEPLDNIVGALDEIVYVSDIVTYDLYYLNPAGRRMTGAYDYKGQKCYKVLQDRNDPCEFCNNSCLRKENFYIWEWDNKKLKRHFMLKDKLIPWQGKLARLELAVDISEKEVVSKAVREKLDFAENVLTSAKALAEEPDMKRATQRMLASVVEFYQSDRAYIFEPVPGKEDYWSNTYEWCRDGISHEMDNLQEIDPDILARWMKLFRRNEAVVIANVDDLQEKEQGEWKVLSDQGIRRLIAVPIQKEGQLVGFLGVDNPRHCISDDALIRTLSLFVANRFKTNETEERLGELLELNYRDVLKDTNLGLWYIRLDPNSDRREMLADETMRRILGIDRVLTPQECYDHWYSRINDGYYQYVDLAVNSMIESGKVVQLEYPWQHPTQGEIMVRCTGIRMKDTDGMICLEGCHRTVSDLERPKFLSETPAGEMFEFNEKRGSIYFHTSRKLLDGEETHEENFPACWLEKKMIHPHFAERFSNLFHQVKQSSDSEEELLMRSKKGSYEWFKLRIHHLGKNVKDRDTVLVLLDAADRERVLQLENQRIRDFYQASLSDAIAYAEVDLESGQLKSSGGLWSDYEGVYDQEPGSLLRFMRRQAKDAVRISEHMRVLAEYDNWKEVLSGEQSIKRFRYQRCINGEWRWVELVAHGFREQYTDNMFALLYMKDIDAQVRREQAQEEAARRDPLTGVFNRNAFESQVKQYMEDPENEGCGVVILLDIDNFKSVNDRLGHLEGDSALRYVTELLKSTFRQKDMIGRLGGDEFLVFLKGTVSDEALHARMESLYAELDAYPSFPIGCSAGIVRVVRENFSYKDSLYKADMALYASKKGGKHHYTLAKG